MAIRIGYPEREKLIRELEEALASGNTERTKRARAALKAFDKGGARRGGRMAKAKTADEDIRTQRHKFIDAARGLGTDESEDVFRGVVRKIASAPGAKAKKAAKKRKRK